ncbi:MAG TPA: primosomal protein N' [Vicinamibacterales bacterium]
MAVPVPALESLTYSLPDDVPDPPVGARVLVPLGNRVLTGCVVQENLGTREPANPGTPERGNPGTVRVKPIIEVLDTTAFLPEDVVELATWVADYYACGIGEALATAFPPLSAPKETGRPAAFRTIRIAQLTAQGLEIASRDLDPTLKLGARQREALAMLSGAPDGIETSILAARGISSSAIARLSALGLVAFTRQRVERDPLSSATAIDANGTAGTNGALVLTREQDAALATLRSLAARRQFQAALLHGVTGSGKTEIYLRLAADVRAMGRGVLLLVPEIALTPAAAGLFRRAFGERVAIQHSGLSDGERHDQWHRIRRGDVDVVVGTRSAVFAPIRSLGLVIVDEEHDGSYKQEESPRYHGRDVAVMRARQANALAVLGSATPSMESYQNAQSGRYTLVTLERRVLDRPLADVRIVDMREEYAAEGPDVVLSRVLRDALSDRLARNEQAIVLLNRRGFASAVFCRQCASTLDCPNCSLSLTVHRSANRARCHYCNYSVVLPKACANCAGPYIELVGFGTERIEDELKSAYPTARVARVDRDTIRKRGAIATLLARFAAREIDVLVGTQMIAKGHDFPRVTLVGVISADVGLGLADFRAAERTFQLLTQVAGRAGRGEIKGEAIVQTLFPNHYSIRHACRQDYASFFKEELKFRQAMQYPPAVALINAVVKGRTHQLALRDAAAIVQALRANPQPDARTRGSMPYRVLGPAPAPLSRLKGEHRVQFFMKGAQRASMRQALLAALAARPEVRRRTIVDVDPMSVL